MFVLAVFVWLLGCVLVVCARVRVCVRVCWWLCVRVFDDVGHVTCCVLWVDVSHCVWRTVLVISNTAPTVGRSMRGTMR